MICWVAWGTLALINVAGFFLVRYDKRAAQRSHRADPPDRIPERAFQLIAAIGGWPGEVAAMRAYRHKTRKRGFQALMVLAAIVGTLGWIGWLALFECLDPRLWGLR